MGAHLVFLDESGFLLIPNLVRTWAPRGRTPVHRHRQRHDRVSVISAISVSPRCQRLGLYYQLCLENIGRWEVCAFLRHLLSHLRGPIIVLLDNLQTRKGGPLDQLRRRHPRLRLEYFPAYAPELNPDEGVWSLAKRRLANSGPDDLNALLVHLFTVLRELRRTPSKLRGCVQQSELPSFLR